jgi:transcriptional regulator with XRE-family HTH domain
MCPLEEPEEPRKPPATRGRASIQNYKVMRWLNEERERRGLSLRDVAQSLGSGYRNATRVAQYFSQRIVAGPDVLQRLAIAVGVSPIDALWNAGHCGAVLDYFNKLYRLGWSWARQDQVAIHQDFGADFMRCYPAGEFPAGRDLREPPQRLAHRYHEATVYNRAGIFRTVALPKPMACAILLAVALFPRRGDQLRRETTDFYSELSLIASQMMRAAEIARVPPNVGHYKPIKDAEAVWKFNFYGRKRLAIIAEYVHAWCDFVCRNYANYARLALYERGGLLGEPVKSDGAAHEDIWTWQHTSIPSAEDLRLEMKAG